MTTEENQDNTEPLVETTSATSELPSDSKNLGMLCHLLSLTACFSGIGSILGPLILWLIKKDQDAFVDEQGKESINFNITVIILVVISAILIPLFGLGLLLMGLITIAWFVLTIIASIAASKGESYKYPFSFKFLK